MMNNQHVAFIMSPNLNRLYNPGNITDANPCDKLQPNALNTTLPHRKKAAITYTSKEVISMKSSTLSAFDSSSNFSVR